MNNVQKMIILNEIAKTQCPTCHYLCKIPKDKIKWLDYVPINPNFNLKRCMFYIRKKK